MPIGTKKFETNSDHTERQKFQIIQRSKKPIVGVKTEDGREIPFGKRSRAAEITDAGLAHEIHDSVGQGGTGDVLVVPMEKQPDPIHTRTFLGVRLPWHTDEHRFGESTQ